MKITISGFPGSGSSTIARKLAEKLDFKYVNAGDIWDEMSKERNTDVLGLNIMGETDPSIDKELDEKMLKHAKEEGNILLEGRIIGWLCSQNNIDAFKTWLAAPINIRAGRISRREKADFQRTKKETEEREKSEAKRYKKYYNIDIKDLSVYDLVVDSSKKTPKEIVGFILDKLKEKEWI
jgi:predicted cytidylate kinase